MPTPRSPYFTIARVSIEDEDDLWAIYLGKQSLRRSFVITGRKELQEPGARRSR